MFLFSTNLNELARTYTKIIISNLNFRILKLRLRNRLDQYVKGIYSLRE